MRLTPKQSDGHKSGESPLLLEDTLHWMGQHLVAGWDFAPYEPFSNWAKELDGTNWSATLDKHRLVLARLGTSVATLACPTGMFEVKEGAGLQGMSSWGKGKKAAMNIEEVEEMLLYDLLVCPFLIC